MFIFHTSLFSWGSHFAESIHLTDKCVDVTFIVIEDDRDIVALTDVTIIVSDDESDIDIIVHGRDTPYSPPASDEDTESDDSTADLFAQMYETYPDSEWTISWCTLNV